MLVLLFDLFISSIITLMVYSLARWIGMPMNIAGFIAGCLFVTLLVILRGDNYKNLGDE
jgi:hypothetical protein